MRRRASILAVAFLVLAPCAQASGRRPPSTVRARTLAHRALHADAIRARATSSLLGACVAGRARVRCDATLWVLADDGGEWRADYRIYVLRRHGHLMARSGLLL